MHVPGSVISMVVSHAKKPSSAIKSDGRPMSRDAGQTTNSSQQQVRTPTENCMIIVDTEFLKESHYALLVCLCRICTVQIQ